MDNEKFEAKLKRLCESAQSEGVDAEEIRDALTQRAAHFDSGHEGVPTHDDWQPSDTRGRVAKWIADEVADDPNYRRDFIEGVVDNWEDSTVENYAAHLDDAPDGGMKP